MSCNLDKNKNNKITGVKDQNGEDSKLFRKIVSNPHLTVEDAVEVYKNIYTEQLRQSTETLDNNSKGVAHVKEAAEEFKKAMRITRKSSAFVAEIDSKFAEEISEEYAKAEHNPTAAEVKAAYDAFEEETLVQYDFIIEKGLKVERYDKNEEPYSNSTEMLKDLEKNHLFFLPNDEAFGKEGDDTSGRRGLKSSGRTLEDGYEMTLSEVFRVVHDYFGHGILGNQFGAIGEENATLQHLDLYSRKAVPAVVFQTRGQNSWVNFSGVNKSVLLMFKQAKELKKAGKVKESQELLEKAKKMFNFAEPKDGIFKNKYNYRRYDTVRRIREQKQIDLAPNQYGSDDISSALPRISRNNVVQGGINRGSGGVRRTIQSYVLEDTSEITLPQETQEAIRKAFPQITELPKIIEIKDGAVYRELQIKGLKKVPMSGSVTIHTAEEYNSMRMFVTEDGHTGITLTKDGHLGGAFASVKSGRKADLAQLMVIGIKEGATNAEAFDTFLPNYYARFGFKAVSRVAFNEEIAEQNGWNYKEYNAFNDGKPDVVHLIYDGGDRNTIEYKLDSFELYGNYQKAEAVAFDKDSYMDSYALMEREVVKRYDYESKNIANPLIIQSPVYTAVFFDTAAVTAKYEQVHPNLFSHRSTIAFKPANTSDIVIGENQQVRVIGRLTTDKVDVLLVENPLSKNKFPHITLSTAEGVKPFESNKEIENNQDKIVPLNDVLEGTLGAFDGSNEIVRFQTATPLGERETRKPTVDRLIQTELAENVFELPTQEIEAKLVELGVTADVAKQIVEGKSGFYSNAQAALGNLKDKNVKNSKGWVNQLTDVQKNGGVKNVGQELEWLGLEDFLNEYTKENQPKNGNIPFEVVEQYILDNQIEIIEVVKGDNRLVNRREELESLQEQALSEEDYESAEQYERQIQNLAEEVLGDSDTKYSNYQLEGGKNYREILLTLPTFSPKNVKRIEQIDKEMFNLNSQPYSEKIKSERNRLMEEYKNLKRQTKNFDTYKSNHWEEPNILAHIRLNERTLPNGERVLFIEEVQSDWAQAGRKKGFNVPDVFIEPNVIKVEGKFHIADSQGNMMSTVEYESKEEAIEDTRKQYEYNKEAISDKSTYSAERKPSNILVNGQQTEDNFIVSRKVLRSKGRYGLIKVGTYSTEDYYNEKQAIDKGYTEENRKELEKQEKVVDMPYKNTDQWVGMAMRKVYQMAAQEGFDRIAWVTGEQSADRYDLSKQIQTIRLVDFKKKYPTQNPTKQYVLYAYDKSGSLVIDQMVEENEVEDYVGKEIAKKLLSKESSNSKLDIGVEYDKIDEGNNILYQGKAVGYITYVTGYPNEVYVNLNKTGERFSVVKSELLNGIEDSYENIIEGDDIVVGGEGMKTFYNTMLPKVAKKEAQRFDKGAKVEVIDFGNSIIDKNIDNYTIEEIERKEYDDNSVGGRFILRDRNGKAIHQQPIEYIEGKDLEGAKNYFETYLKQRYNYDIQKNEGLPLEQLSIPITKGIKEAAAGPVAQFQKTLSEKGIHLTTSGFVHKKDVYLNTDVATGETAIHEFSHLFNSHLKQNRPDLYKRGSDLITAELAKDNSEIKDTIDRVRTTQPNLEGEALVEEIMAQLTGEKGAELLNKGESSNIIDWIKEVFQEIGRMLGLLEATPQQIANMTISEFAKASAVQLLKGKSIAQRAQEYFTREADRLPLTLAVFANPKLVELQGKMVNPVTVKQLLNQSGIKQIEKDLIISVIDENYAGQKRVSYDEIEASVRANIMPLERLITTSYSSYGMDNLGDGDYGSAKTIIFNAPVDHGITGHFPSDFKSDSRKDVKYIPKQLNDNVWVAVEEGYESQANNENVHQFVGTAGTREVVDAWIENYEKPTKAKKDYTSYMRELEAKYDNGRISMVATEEERAKLSKLRELVQEEEINKGLFGHIRVWEGDGIFYAAEFQSDYFQKNNARKQLIPFAPEYTSGLVKLQKKYRDLSAVDYKKVGITFNLEDFSKLNLSTPLWIRRAVDSGAITIEDNSTISELLNSIEVSANSTNIEDRRKTDGYVKEVVKIMNDLSELTNNKDYVKELDVLKDKYLSLTERQFIASQKLWEQRMVREIIKEAALSGATTLRFPTPYTLSVIEGYINAGGFGEGAMPYEIGRAYDQERLRQGDTILIDGHEYIVIESDSDSIEVASMDDVFINNVYDFINEEVDYRTESAMEEEIDFMDKLFTEEEWDDFDKGYFLDDTELTDIAEETENEGVYRLVGDKVEEVVRDYYERMYESEGVESMLSDMGYSNIQFNGDTVYYTDESANLESFNQPDGYEGTSSKEDFDIETSLDRDARGEEKRIYNDKTGEYDIDRTQRTVVYKYLEIAEVFRKELPLEVIEDDNGFEWQEATIAQETSIRPVVAFQKVVEPTLSYVNQDFRVFDNFAEALRETPTGMIDGYLDSEKVFSIDSDSNPDTYNGLINHLIKEEILTGEQILDKDGRLIHITEGATEVKKIITAEIAQEAAIKTVGRKGVKQTKDSNIVFEKKKENTRTVVDKKGQEVEVDSTELQNATFEELKEKYDNPVTLLAEQQYKAATRPFSDKKVLEEAQEFIPENELQKALMELLKKLGIKTTSIEAYVQAYAKKNGVEPSAQALADIAEKIIAFQNGEINQEDLTEEVAHFIIETSDQAEIEDLLRNVHKTAEWKQYAEQYRPLYETEDQLRREILGKVLANAIQANFATEQRQGVELNIVERLQKTLQDFFNKIRAYFRPQYKKDLDGYTEKIYTNLLSRTLYSQLNTEQLEGNKLIFYSASNTVNSPIDVIYQKSLQALDLLESQARKIPKSPSKGAIQSARTLIEKQDENLKIKAVSEITRIVRKHTKYLQNAIKSNTQKSYPFSQEEQVVYTTTIGTLLGQLRAINEVLDVKDKTQKIVKAEVEQTILDINALQGQKTNLETNVWEQIVDRLVKKHNLSEADRQELLVYYDSARKDTNWFFANVSSMVHAQDPLLNASADIISRMTTNWNISSNRRVKKLLNALEKIGFNPQALKKFKRGKYLFNPYDFDRLENEVQAEKLRIYNQMKATTLTKEEFAELEKGEGLDLTPTEKQDYYEAVQKFETDNHRVDRLKPEARAKKDALLANFSREVVRFDKDRARERNIITEDAIANGFEYTREHRHGLEEINKERQKAKSPFQNGELVKGLLIQNDGTVIQDPSYPVLEDEAKFILELNQLDAARAKIYKDKLEQEGLTEKDIPELFLKKLREKSPKDQLEFMLLNANLSFSNEFWDTLTSGSNIIQRLEDAEQSDELLVLMQEIKQLQVKRSFLLKQNRVHNQPSETSEDITIQDMESIKEVEELLQDKYKLAKKYLEKTEYVESDFSENTVNNAYLAKLKDRGIKTIEETVEFIRGHVTPSDVKRIDAAKTMAEEIIRTNRTELSPMYASIFDTANYSDDASVRKEQVYEDLLKYAESRLLPYYKRLEPTGFTDIMNAMQEEILSVEDFVEGFQQGSYPYLNLTPNFIFDTEVDNDNLNPEYIYNEERGLPQIKKQYSNKEYGDYFGNITYTQNVDGTYSQTAQKNTKDFEALQALMEYHEESLKATNMERHNKYLLPQRGMRGFRQYQELTNGLKASTFKEIWKDATSFREDEKQYGEGAAGTSLGARQAEMIVPKYGFSLLENQEDLTDELLESYTWMGHEAEGYKARMDAFADMEAVKTLILEKQYGGKSAEASNIYKMFESAYKYNIYGQNETFSYETDLFGLLSKKKNLAPLAKKFQWWIRLVNLGFSLIVPITSLLQGGVNLMIERFVGERIDKDASRLANKLVGKYVSGAVSDSLAFNSKSKLNSVAEYFGVFNLQERFNNSNYNKFSRGIMKSSFLTHTIADAPVKAKVVLTILNDFRVVDGSIQNFQQYKRAQQVIDPTLSEKQVRANWAKTEANVLLNYLDTVDGITEINSAKLSKDLGQDVNSQAFKDYVELKTQAIRDSMSVLTTEIDTLIPQEQKSIAQRHAIFSFFFLHRGWMTVAYNRKLKNRHINPYTGLKEEGNWMGTATFIRDMINEGRNPANTRGFLSNMKNMWDNADETTRRSLHRTAVEIAVANSMAVLALILMGMADDDDDESWALQAGAYMAYRTTNEVVSVSGAYPRQIFEFLKSPVIGLDKLKAMGDVFDLASSDTITQGRFRDYSERERFIYKNFPLTKEYFNVTNAKRTRDMYEYYNKDNFDFPWVWSTYLFAEKEE